LIHLPAGGSERDPAAGNEAEAKRDEDEALLIIDGDGFMPIEDPTKGEIRAARTKFDLLAILLLFILLLLVCV